MEMPGHSVLIGAVKDQAKESSSTVVLDTRQPVYTYYYSNRNKTIIARPTRDYRYIIHHWLALGRHQQETV